MNAVRAMSFICSSFMQDTPVFGPSRARKIQQACVTFVRNFRAMSGRFKPKHHFLVHLCDVRELQWWGNPKRFATHLDEHGNRDFKGAAKHTFNLPTCECSVLLDVLHRRRGILVGHSR